jgi:hypothetical protein
VLVQLLRQRRMPVTGVDRNTLDRFRHRSILRVSARLRATRAAPAPLHDNV